LQDLKRCYFVGIDLATRVVVGHFFKEGSIQVDDIVKGLEVILEARSFKVEIVHKDSLFGNTRYYEFLKSNDVEPSLNHRRWLWSVITTYGAIKASL